jgi:hypothetical protein
MALTIENLPQSFMDTHDLDCNQKYGDTLPYSFHLTCVWQQALKFKYLLDDYLISNPNDIRGINFQKIDLVHAACFGHDLIEDARVSYNSIIEVCQDVYFGTKLADIIYCLTDEKGKTRDSHGQAIKATYVEFEEEDGSIRGKAIFKDPKTGDGMKKSAKGLLCVQTDELGKMYLQNEVNWEQEGTGMLQEIFREGELLNQTTLQEIRKRLTN